MPEIRSKTGNGAFHLTVNDDGSVLTSIDPSGAHPHEFSTARRAYEFARPLAGDPSYWNLAYHLEDFLPNDDFWQTEMSHER